MIKIIRIFFVWPQYQQMVCLPPPPLLIFVQIISLLYANWWMITLSFYSQVKALLPLKIIFLRNFSDDTYCSPGQWRCLESVDCIDEIFRCDSVSHCPQHSDEVNCRKFDWILAFIFSPKILKYKKHSGYLSRSSHNNLQNINYKKLVTRTWFSPS